uniref:glutathione transferase n=1 Tax=Otolemur garnettii TaxID=30611 RepID=H0Y0Z3_OTOGA
MTGKPKLHYFNGRGRMESIRWLLAAAGVEFEEIYIKSAEDLDKLRNVNVSIQARSSQMYSLSPTPWVLLPAVMRLHDSKENLIGISQVEQAAIEMASLVSCQLLLAVNPSIFLTTETSEFRAKVARETPEPRPGHEEVLKSHGQDYMVGNRLSKADVLLVELIYNMEELDPSLTANFPLLKALKTRISNLPTVKKFLQPGSQRKFPLDAKALEEAKKIFRL